MEADGNLYSIDLMIVAAMSRSLSAQLPVLRLLRTTGTRPSGLSCRCD
jgi:hypothetical protein